MKKRTIKSAAKKAKSTKISKIRSAKVNGVSGVKRAKSARVNTGKKLRSPVEVDMPEMKSADRVDQVSARSPERMGQSIAGIERAKKVREMPFNDGRVGPEIELQEDFVGANSWDPRIGFYKVSEGEDSLKVADEIYAEKAPSSKRLRKVNGNEPK